MIGRGATRACARTAVPSRLYYRSRISARPAAESRASRNRFLTLPPHTHITRRHGHQPPIDTAAYAFPKARVLLAYQSLYLAIVSHRQSASDRLEFRETYARALLKSIHDDGTSQHFSQCMEDIARFTGQPYFDMILSAEYFYSHFIFRLTFSRYFITPPAFVRVRAPYHHYRRQGLISRIMR